MGSFLGVIGLHEFQLTLLTKKYSFEGYMGFRDTRELLRDVLHASKMPTLNNLLIYQFLFFVSKDRNIYPAVHNEYSVHFSTILLQSNFKYFH